MFSSLHCTPRYTKAAQAVAHASKLLRLTVVWWLILELEHARSSLAARSMLFTATATTNTDLAQGKRERDILKFVSITSHSDSYSLVGSRSFNEAIHSLYICLHPRPPLWNRDNKEIRYRKEEWMLIY